MPIVLENGTERPPPNSHSWLLEVVRESAAADGRIAARLNEAVRARFGREILEEEVPTLASDMSASGASFFQACAWALDAYCGTLLVSTPHRVHARELGLTSVCCGDALAMRGQQPSLVRTGNGIRLRGKSWAHCVDSTTGSFLVTVAGSPTAVWIERRAPGVNLGQGTQFRTEILFEDCPIEPWRCVELRHERVFQHGVRVAAAAAWLGCSEAELGRLRAEGQSMTSLGTALKNIQSFRLNYAEAMLRTELLSAWVRGPASRLNRGTLTVYCVLAMQDSLNAFHSLAGYLLKPPPWSQAAEDIASGWLTELCLSCLASDIDLVEKRSEDAERFGEGESKGFG